MSKDFNADYITKIKSKKIEGITRRWLILIIGLVVLLFTIAFIVCTSLIKVYYYSSVESIVNSAASDSAVNYFENNINNGESLESSAALYIDTYSNKDSTTVWIVDNEGNVIISSNGFAVEKQKMPDYQTIRDVMNQPVQLESEYVKRCKMDGIYLSDGLVKVLLDVLEETTLRISTIDA